MPTMRRIVLLLVLAALVVAGGCDGDPEASSRVSVRDAALTDALGPVDDAVVLLVSGPDEVACGEAAEFEIVVENTGTTEWTDQYRLLSVDPRGLVGDLERAVPEPAAPGESVTFRFAWQAPETPGRRSLFWEFLDSEGDAFELSVSALATVRCDPPAFRLREVTWLDEDVRMWERTSELMEVRFREDDSQLCFIHTRSGDWENVEVDGVGVAANTWVFIYRDDQWYGATWDWLATDESCKFTSSVSGTNIRRSPFDTIDGWEPLSGEVLYFMVSGLARSEETRNVMERSNAVRVVWP
jgi:hypothetical protein